MNKITSFIEDIRYEIKETTWPTAKEMRKNTISVFTIVFLFAVFFFITETIIVKVLPFI